ncbi:hypothetical protein CEXT_34771 [Caerostris extrusa]|uniref:Uncharacterized protein n=1 Tax=Caerostris extrusa TaxID=172846 RepID=A0AAV4VVV3_CAEEX|nr:hypothetical protein CEXT_34771 [Caerostris extrusa]
MSTLEPRPDQTTAKHWITQPRKKPILEALPNQPLVVDVIKDQKREEPSHIRKQRLTKTLENTTSEKANFGRSIAQQPLVVDVLNDQKREKKPSHIRKQRVTCTTLKVSAETHFRFPM